jgi:hypothetical protein
MRALLASAIALAAFTTAASAIDMNFLKHAPISRLSADELKQFRAFIAKTLDESADGSTADWRAPKTSFSSKVTPQKNAVDGRFKCREARIESESRDLQQSGNYWFCKSDKGGWQLRTPSENAQRSAK